MRQEFRCPECGSKAFGSTMTTDMSAVQSRTCHGCRHYHASVEEDYKHFITIPETKEEADLLAKLDSVINNAAGPFEATTVKSGGEE